MADSGKKRWVTAHADRDLARELAAECGIDPLVALLLVGRGMQDPAEVEEFLSDDVPMGDPFALQDMELAVERIGRALHASEKIAIYGDYDCDGVTATCLLSSYFAKRGVQTVSLLPERKKEGYGMHIAGVQRLKEQGVDLIITVDNGVRALEEVAYAKELGMDVVVTDHHLPGGELPGACAVIDAHRADCPSEFKEYAGVGVALLLAAALEGVPCEALFPAFGDLAAIGTVADIVPLIGENRIIVRAGLDCLARTERPGLQALLRQCGLADKRPTAQNIAYGIGPRLNAAGRLGSAQAAADLLLCTDATQGELLASRLEEQNRLRHELEAEMVEEACLQIDADPALQYARVLVVAGEHWEEGVLGIAAARLAQKYGKPAVVLRVEEGIAKGSARSVADFDLYRALEACSSYFHTFGGHKQAAGLTLDANQIPAFREAINAYAAQEPMPFPQLKLDCKLNPKGLNLDTAEVLQALEPFGCANERPLFGLFGMRLESISPVGGGAHLRLGVSREGVCVQAMLFGTRPEQFAYQAGDVVDLAVEISVNVFRGTRSVSAVVRDMRLHGEPEALFDQIRLYEAYRRGDELDGKELHALLPEREDLAVVFRYLRAGGGYAFSPWLLCERLEGKVSYAKMCCALDVLEEMHIIQREPQDRGGVIRLCPVQEKQDLERSELLKALRARERGCRCEQQ